MIRIIYNAFLKKWGSFRYKKAVWDSEFLKGKWDYLNKTDGDPIYFYIEKYLGSGRVLDLGCGTGNTLYEIRKENLSFYTCVDISEIAIRKAMERCSSIRSNHYKIEFYVSDIFDYQPNTKYDIILFRESIYYITNIQRTKILEKYSSHLVAGGVFIVRLWNRNKYKSIISSIKRNYAVIEEYLPPNSKTTIIIFSKVIIT